MNSPYEILGVSRSASDETIKAAFHKAAKASHPDLNADDRTAEERLRRVIAAYQILKCPQQRAAYDLQLRNLRRARARGFAVPVFAGLVSGTVVALAVWLSMPQLHTQVASGLSRTSTIVGPMPGQSAEQSRASPARQWQQVEASGDPKAIWAFVVRNPDAPESALARSRLIGLIDTAEDVSLLHVLRLVATDTIAERARERLVRLGALAVARAEVADVPPSNSVQASREKTIAVVSREEPVSPAVEVKSVKMVSREEPALQAAEVVTIDVATRVEPALQAPVAAPRKGGNREKPVARKTIRIPRNGAKRRAASHTGVKQAASENRETSTCAGSQSCAGSATALFGVGF